MDPPRDDGKVDYSPYAFSAFRCNVLVRPTLISQACTSANPWRGISTVDKVHDSDRLVHRAVLVADRRRPYYGVMNADPVFRGPEGQTRWFCSSCMDSLDSPTGETPTVCAQGHSDQPSDLPASCQLLPAARCAGPRRGGRSRPGDPVLDLFLGSRSTLATAASTIRSRS
jgi:hypothetical protein